MTSRKASATNSAVVDSTMRETSPRSSWMRRSSARASRCSERSSARTSRASWAAAWSCSMKSGPWLVAMSTPVDEAVVLPVDAGEMLLDVGGGVDESHAPLVAMDMNLARYVTFDISEVLTHGDEVGVVVRTDDHGVSHTS